MKLRKIKQRRQNKKGSIINIIIFVIMAFVIVMFFGLYYYAHGQISSKLSSLTASIGTEGDTVGSISADTFGRVHSGLNVLKLLTFALIFGMILTTILGNILTRIHPALFVPYFFFILLAIILSVFISNAYEDFLANPVFGSTLQGFTASTFILLYLPIWAGAVGFLGLIIALIGIMRDRESPGGII